MKGNLERLRRLAAVLALVAVLALPAGVAAEDFLTLEESIELALRQSVLIHAAEEGVRAAEALKKEAFTGFLPKLSTSYNYTRLNSEPYTTCPPCRR